MLLDEQGIANITQTLFEYQAASVSQAFTPAIKSADIFIFVSVAAVNFAHKLQLLTLNANQQVFAVGSATQNALCALGITQVLAPPAQSEHSEGLLKLTELSNIHSKSVIIFRGNGGREHLASSLKKRGAKVNYCECYQRVWHELPVNIASQWHAQQINCIVVTSKDILVKLQELLTNDSKANIDYWKTECTLLVVSERIANKAKESGFTRVINTQSANAKKLYDALKNLSCS